MYPIPVLEFLNSVARGGIEEQVLMLLRGLDRTRFLPYLVCTPQLKPRIERDLPDDVTVIPLAFEQPHHLLAALRFGAVLRKYRIQIVHSHGFYSSLCASPVAWLNRVPVVIEESHGREAWRKGWKARFFVDRVVSRFVDAHLAVSKANARYLSEEKKLSQKKITVIYPGVNLARFDPGHKPPDGLRQSVGITEGDRVIVFVGRLEPQKGHQVLLDAMPSVVRVFPRVRLICAGEGALRDALESKARAELLTEHVRFIGYPADIRDWLAIADMTVLPSFYEGLPVTPIESLASGKPVVATAVDGTPEVVIDGKTGFTIPPGDANRLAEAICRMLGNRDLAESLATVGRKWVLENFSVQRLLERTEKFYLEQWETQARRNRMSASNRLQRPSAEGTE